MVPIFERGVVQGNSLAGRVHLTASFYRPAATILRGTVKFAHSMVTDRQPEGSLSIPSRRDKMSPGCKRRRVPDKI